MTELDKIYNCDCIDLLQSMPDKCVDFICTDPPYLFENNGGGVEVHSLNVPKR